MTAREVYERSMGKPWAVDSIDYNDDSPTKWWQDWTGHDPGWRPLEEWLAEAAMMRGMVEWFHQMTGEVGSGAWDAAVRQHKLYYITPENLLLACQSLHEQQKGAGRE